MLALTHSLTNERTNKRTNTGVCYPCNMFQVIMTLRHFEFETARHKRQAEAGDSKNSGLSTNPIL